MKMSRFVQMFHLVQIGTWKHVPYLKRCRLRNETTWRLSILRIRSSRGNVARSYLYLEIVGSTHAYKLSAPTAVQIVRSTRSDLCFGVIYMIVCLTIRKRRVLFINGRFMIVGMKDNRLPKQKSCLGTWPVGCQRVKADRKWNGCGASTRIRRPYGLC